MRIKVPIIMLITPFLIFSVLFIVVAMAQTVNISLGHDALMGMHGWTLKYYRLALGNHVMMWSFYTSFIVTLVSSVGACILGLLLAFALRVDTTWQSKALMKTTQLIIALPHIFIVLVFIWCFSQTGLIPRILIAMGLDIKFPLLIGDDHQFGVILAYLWKETPYVLMTLLLVIRRLDDTYFLVARNLGAGRLQRFWHIGLPMVQRSFFNALIIVFSFSFGAYEVPALLGNSRLELIPVVIYDLYQQSDLTLRPLIMSLNGLLTMFVIGFDLLLLALSRLLPGGGKKTRI